MSRREEITYALDFRARGAGHEENKMLSSDNQRSDSEPAGRALPRIARLMALAIRFDGLLRAEEFRDYAEIALGEGTRMVSRHHTTLPDAVMARYSAHASPPRSIAVP